MTNGTMKVNVSKRFNGEGKVYAFNVRIDNELYAEVSKHNALKLLMQAEDVARELNMDINVYGQQYLVAA